MKDTIVPHHTADSTQGDQYRKTYAYHDNGAPRADGTLKWNPGLGIQYHFFIEKTGKLVTERREDDLLYHAGKWNYRSIAICFAGNFLEEAPTLAQIETYVNLVNELKERHDIKFIMNHYEIRQTSCPIIDLRSVYENEMKRRALVITGPSFWRREYRKVARQLRDATYRAGQALERKQERLKVLLNGDFDDRDCCT